MKTNKGGTPTDEGNDESQRMAVHLQSRLHAVEEFGLLRGW